MDAVVTANSSPATSVRQVTSPARSGSRRRHLWSRKSKSEPEKDQAACRAAVVSSVAAAHHHRDNLGYALDSNSTGTVSPVMPLRARNAAVQCILLDDSNCRGDVKVGSGVTSTTGRLAPTSTSGPTGCGNTMTTSAMPNQWHDVSVAPVSLTSSSSKPRLVHQTTTTTTGVRDDLNAYRTAAQYQRRKAIALANGEAETLLTRSNSNCPGSVPRTFVSVFTCVIRPQNCHCVSVEC